MLPKAGEIKCMMLLPAVFVNGGFLKVIFVRRKPFERFSATRLATRPAVRTLPPLSKAGCLFLPASLGRRHWGRRCHTLLVSFSRVNLRLC